MRAASPPIECVTRWTRLRPARLPRALSALSARAAPVRSPFHAYRPSVASTSSTHANLRFFHQSRHLREDGAEDRATKFAQLSEDDPRAALDYYKSAVNLLMGQLKGKEKAAEGTGSDDELEIKSNIVRALVGQVEIWMDPQYDLWCVSHIRSS